MSRERGAKARWQETIDLVNDGVFEQTKKSRNLWVDRKPYILWL